MTLKAGTNIHYSPSSAKSRAASGISSGGSSSGGGSKSGSSITGSTSSTFDAAVAANQAKANLIMAQQGNAKAQAAFVEYVQGSGAITVEQAKTMTVPEALQAYNAYASQPQTKTYSMPEAVDLERQRLITKYGAEAASVLNDKNIENQFYQKQKQAEVEKYVGYSGPDISQGLKSIAQNQEAGYRAEDKTGMIATSAGPSPFKNQEAVAALHARNAVDFGGAMEGQYKSDTAAQKQALFQFGGERIFERLGTRQQASEPTGLSLTKQLSFKKPVIKEQFTVGNKTFDNYADASKYILDSQAQAWRAAGVYESPDVRMQKAATSFSLTGFDFNIPGGAGMKEYPMPSIVSNPEGFIKDQNKIVGLDLSEGGRLQADVEAAVNRSLNPKIKGFGLDIPSVKVPNNWVLPWQKKVPEESGYSKESNEITYTKPGWQGEYAQAFYGGGTLGALAATPGGPAAVGGFLVGGIIGVTYKALYDVSAPTYSKLVETVTPKGYEEYGAIIATPGMPGVNVGLYYATKEYDAMKSKLTGSTPMKPSEVSGEVAGQFVGLLGSSLIGMPLMKYVPTAKGDYTQLKYREVKMPNVNIEGSDAWRGLVFEKGDKVKFIGGFAGKTSTGYGVVPKAELDFTGIGTNLKGITGLMGEGKQVGYDINRFKSSGLTKSTATGADELNYLSSARSLMRDTRTQTVPKNYLKEMDLTQVSSVPKEYAPKLSKLITNEKDYFVFGGAARESQVLEPKSTHDIDLFLRKAVAADKTSYYVKELSTVKGPPIRVSPESPGLVEVNMGGNWKHMLDIHDMSSPEIQAGVKVNPEYFGYGFKIKNPTVEIGGKVFRQLGEEGTALGAASAIPKKLSQPFSPTETKIFDQISAKYVQAGGKFEPAPHRLKDVINFERIQNSLVTYGKETGSKKTPQDLTNLGTFKQAASNKFLGVTDKAGTTLTGEGWFAASKDVMSSLTKSEAKISPSIGFNVKSPSMSRVSSSQRYMSVKSSAFSTSKMMSFKSPAASQAKASASSQTYSKIASLMSSSPSVSASKSTSYQSLSPSGSRMSISRSTSVSPSKASLYSSISSITGGSPSKSPSPTPQIPNYFREPPRRGIGGDLMGDMNKKMNKVLGTKETYKNPWKSSEQFAKDLLGGKRSKKWIL